MSTRFRQTIWCVLFMGVAARGAAEARWTRLALPTPAARVQALTLDYAGNVFAGTDNNGVLRSSDGGTTWVHANAGLLSLNVYALASKPGGSGILYAGTLGGVFRSSDRGDAWALVLPSRSVLSLAVDPSASATVYAGTDVGVFKSTDDGLTWSLASNGLSKGIASLAIDPRATGTVYAGTIDWNLPGVPTGAGVFKTIDGGGHWSALPGIPTKPVFSLSIDPSPPATVYAGVGATDPGVYVSKDDGADWTKAALDGAINALAVDAANPGVVYAGANGVFRSADRGRSWARVVNGLSAPDGSQALVLSLVTGVGATVYAGTGLGDGAVYRAQFATTGSCIGSESALCLQDGRFRVSVDWTDTRVGGGGAGRSMPITLDTGAFWFFSSNNLELVVKVVDGRSFNDRFWVFGGALTDVAYTIKVEDTVSGAVKTYANPQGVLASFADTSAFAR